MSPATRFGSGIAAACLALFLAGCGAPPPLSSQSPTTTAAMTPATATATQAAAPTPAATTPTASGGQASASARPGGSSAAEAKPGTSAVTRRTTSAAPSSARPTASPSRKPGTATAAPIPPPAATPAGKAMVGYYPGWAAASGYTPNSIPVAKVTHIHYAFAKIDPQSLQVALADPATDRANFAKLRALKQKNRHLTTRISIGGWDYSGYFSDAAATAQRRDAFARSCVAFLKEHGFDGIDIDWEYPVSGGLAGNHNRPEDTANFTLLLKSLRERLDEQGRADGRRYSLSIAAAANTSYLQKIELGRIVPLVDQIFLMAYDMHGPWDRYADLLAPLYTPGDSSPQYKNSVDAAVSAYLTRGMPADKLVLGMPFYGYRYTGVSEKGNGLYSRFSKAASISYDVLARDYVGKAGYTSLRHAQARVPYLYGQGTFLSYEDPASIADKVRYAKGRRLGGVGAWALSHDRGGVLLDSAYRALQG